MSSKISTGAAGAARTRSSPFRGLPLPLFGAASTGEVEVSVESVGEILRGLPRRRFTGSSGFGSKDEVSLVAMLVRGGRPRRFTGGSALPEGAGGAWGFCLFFKGFRGSAIQPRNYHFIGLPRL